MDFSDSFSPSIPISMSSRLRLVSAQSWCSANIGMSICRSWLENVTYEFLLVFPACSACLVDLTWIVCELEGRWPYNYCFVGSCFQELFKTALSIFLESPPTIFSIRFVSVHVVHPYSSMDTATTRKKSRFILLDWSNFCMINSVSIEFHAFDRCSMTSFSVDEILLSRYVNWSTNYDGLSLRVEMAPFCFKLMYSALFAFT